MTPGRAVVGFLHPGEYAACFAESLIGLLFCDAFGEQRVVSHPKGKIGNETGAGQIVTGRNQLAATFLDETDAEWLLMVDADMGFAGDTLERLIAAADPVERPVVGGLAFACKSDGSGDFLARRYRATPTLYRMHDSASDVGFVPMFDYPRNQLVQVAATGTAMVLIHRSVLAAVRAEHGDHWFNLIEIPKGRNGSTTFGEDLSFCLRLTALGIPMHVHTGVKTTHDKGGVFLDEEFYDLQQAALAGHLVPSPLVDVVIPTFGRAARIDAVAANAVSNTANLHTVTFVVEADDTATIAAVEAIDHPRVRCLINEGPRSYAGAVNHAAQHLKAAWLFTGADDLQFHPAWDEKAIRLAAVTGARVIGTNDLGHPAVMRGDHATHSLVAADYIATGATADGEPGKVLHDYHHNFVDNELVTTARHRGLYAHCHAAKVEHLHPVWGKGAPDDTYTAGNADYDADAALFAKRMAALL